MKKSDASSLLLYNYWGRMSDYSIDYPSSYYRDFFNIEPPVHKRLISSIDNIGGNSILFVKQDILCANPIIIDKLDDLGHRLILISGISSKTFDKPEKIIRSHSIVKWFTTNPPILHPKICPLPIGFEEFDRLDESIKNFINCNVKQCEKQFLSVYSYHSPSFHISRTQELDLSRIGINAMSGKLSYTDYQQLLFSSYSSICLRGQGFDTHRVYESIASFCIPIIDNIVVASVLAFHRLPYLFLSDLISSSKPSDVIHLAWHQVDWNHVQEKLKYDYYEKLISTSRALL